MSEEELIQIQIRCPKCTQRFRVGPELKGRMVECGACEYRFRVDDESLVKSRKFYPGEKKDPTLMRYSRHPHMEFKAAPQMAVAQYADAPQIERVEPTPLSKIVIGIVGGSIMALTLLVLIVGGGKNGFFDGVTTDRRLIIAGFAAVVGVAMLIYANPRARAKATVFSLIGALALVLTPFFFKEGSRDLSERNTPIVSLTPPIVINQGSSGHAELKALVRYEPMEKALIEAGVGGRVVGIWLRGLYDSNSELVENYFMRVSGASESSHLYPRLNQSYLFVLVNPQLTLEELAAECARVGNVNEIVSELYLIDASVDNARFAELPMAKLSDKTDGAFYQLNLSELQGIDIRRVNEALLRLSTVAPVQSRDDIVKRMKELLALCDREMLTNLARALTVWSNGKDGAPEALMKVAAESYKKEQVLSLEVVSFLTKWEQSEIYPILCELWLKNPVEWEDTFMKAGPKAEAQVIPHLEQGDNPLRMSAARIAGRLGSDRSIEALKQALGRTQDIELKTSYQNAIEAIQHRQP